MNSEYSQDPLELFRAWLDTEVVALATATADGAPSVRMVLLKGADEQGLLFFTSYESRKGRELAENPRAAILIHMPGRQIRVEGPVERVPTRRVGRVLGDEAAGQPDRGDGLEPERADRVARGARGAVRRPRPVASGRVAQARALGRLPARPRVVRVLGAPREPPARPHPLPPRRRRLADRTAEPLSTVQP